jgi:hypothetical protein
VWHRRVVLIKRNLKSYQPEVISGLSRPWGTSCQKGVVLQIMMTL